MSDRPGAAIPTMASARVDIWCVPLDADTPQLAHHRSLLNAAERQRADRFRRPTDRNRFTVARARLRMVLSGYLDCPPDSIRFAYGKTGKPTLAGTEQSRGWHFNLSHSGTLAAIAVTRNRCLGIDIECHFRQHPFMDLAERFFSEREVQALWRQPENQRRAAFFRCWTRKEAYLKGLGAGLGRGLGTFDVTVDERQPARLLADRLNPEATSQWSLVQIEVPEHYTAALAVAATSVDLHYREP